MKFDYRVVLGALVGGAVAVANFFLMAVTVQNVVNVTNHDDALRMMRVSYRNRMLMRAIWIIIAIFAPCFNYAAGIIPLFIPSFVIKLRGIKMGITGKNAAPAPAAVPEDASVSQEGAETVSAAAEETLHETKTPAAEEAQQETKTSSAEEAPQQETITS